MCAFPRQYFTKLLFSWIPAGTIQLSMGFTFYSGYVACIGRGSNSRGSAPNSGVSVHVGEAALTDALNASQKYSIGHLMVKPVCVRASANCSHFPRRFPTLSYNLPSPLWRCSSFTLLFLSLFWIHTLSLCASQSLASVVHYTLWVCACVQNSPDLSPSILQSLDKVLMA